MFHQTNKTSHLDLIPEMPEVDLTNSFAGVIAAAAVELSGSAWAKTNTLVITEALRVDAARN